MPFITANKGGSKQEVKEMKKGSAKVRDTNNGYC